MKEKGNIAVGREFKCLTCGEWCRVRGFVRVCDAEISRIAEFLRMDEIAFIDRYTRLAHDRRGLELMERDNGECVFLEGSDCRVHPVKPEQCRLFQEFWSWEGFEEICPAYRKK